MVKVNTSGENKGDVEVHVRARRRRQRRARRRRPSAAASTGQRRLHGHDHARRPERLQARQARAQGQRRLHGLGRTLHLALEGDDLKDISRRARGGHALSPPTARARARGLRRAGPQGPGEPRRPRCGVLTARARTWLPLVTALNENGKLGFDTYDLETSETEGEVKVGVGHRRRRRRQLARARPQSDRTGLVRPAWGYLRAARCASSHHPDARADRVRSSSTCSPPARSRAAAAATTSAATPKVPDGYKTFSTAGISFAYPGDWEVAERTDADGAARRRDHPAREVQDALRPDPAVASRPAPATASRASPTSAGSSSATSTTARSSPTSAVEIPGAKKALRASTVDAAGPGHRPGRGPGRQPRRPARQRRRGRADRRRAAARRARVRHRAPSWRAFRLGTADAARSASASRPGRRWRASSRSLARCVVAVVAPLPAARAGRVAGLERTSPAIVLLARRCSPRPGSSPWSRVVARLTRPVTAEQLGLRAPDDLAGRAAADRGRGARARRPWRRSGACSATCAARSTVPAGARHPQP